MKFDPADLVTVYTVNNAVQAEIIKNALEDEGIRCFVDNEGQAGGGGLTGLEIRISVPVTVAEQARKFLEEHERNRGEE